MIMKCYNMTDDQLNRAAEELNEELTRRANIRKKLEQVNKELYDLIGELRDTDDFLMVHNQTGEVMLSNIIDYMVDYNPEMKDDTMPSWTAPQFDILFSTKLKD